MSSFLIDKILYFLHCLRQHHQKNTYINNMFEIGFISVKINVVKNKEKKGLYWIETLKVSVHFSWNSETGGGDTVQ